MILRRIGKFILGGPDMAKKKSEQVEQVETTLELLRHHLMDVIDHPEKIEQIPNNATVILFPVPVKPKNAA